MINDPWQRLEAKKCCVRKMRNTPKVCMHWRPDWYLHFIFKLPEEQCVKNRGDSEHGRNKNFKLLLRITQPALSRVRYRSYGYYVKKPISNPYLLCTSCRDVVKAGIVLWQVSVAGKRGR